MPFIRDLIPYHSGRFGRLNMTLCKAYLYKYFFNQIIDASFKSELHQRLNAKSSHPATIIYARGTAWKDAKIGLGSIGWKQIGRIYRNCYIFKADFEKIQTFDGFNIDIYPTEVIKHNVYIVVLTQVREGAKYGVYLNNKAPLQPINMNAVIQDFDNGAPNITHNAEMELFFDIIR